MNSSIPTSSVRSLLECYVRAKDQNRPELIFDCFAADAELTFDIATDTIDFPRSVTGAAAIAKTLVADFGQRFDSCRTYYLCAAPDVDDAGISTMPWLVAMRQKDSGAMRLGKGTYRWVIARTPDGSDKIVGLHIEIDRMDVIEDPGSVMLQTLQAQLMYPWLPPMKLESRSESFLAMYPGTALADALRRRSGQ